MSFTTLINIIKEDKIDIYDNKNNEIIKDIKFDLVIFFIVILLSILVLNVIPFNKIKFHS